MVKPVIRPRPLWSLPSESRIAQAKVLPRLLERFEEHAGELRGFRLAAIEHTTTDGLVRKGTIQSFDLVYNFKDKIAWTPDYLCRLAWLAAERYVRRVKFKVQFRIYLTGLNAEGLSEGVFTIKTEHTLKPEANDKTADEDESESDEDPKEEGDDEDDHDDADELPSAMVPMGPSHLVPSGEQHTVPTHHLNPQFIVTLQSNALRLAQNAYQGSMESNRALVKEMRKEMSGMIQDINRSADQNNRSHLAMLEQVTTLFIEGAKHDRERMGALERQLADNSKLNAKSFQNFQEIAQQGWQAFQDAMKMKSDVVDERLRLASHVEDERERTTPAAPSGVGPALMKAAPVGLAGLSILLRKRGDDASADLLAEMAKRFAGPSDEEYEEVDESGEPVDVDAREATPTNGRPSGPTTSSTPFADRVRAFRESLEPDRLDALRTALAAPVWGAFERASKARVDDIAIAALQVLSRAISKDPALQMELAQHLTEDQVLEILTIIEDVKKVAGPGRRPRPQRPDPTPESPPAE